MKRFMRLTLTRKVVVLIAILGLLAVPLVALADNVVNNIDTTVDAALETRTITAGSSTVVGFWIEATTGGGDASGCNATGNDKAYGTLSVPAGVTASQTANLEFVGCGSTNVVNVTFSSSTPGSYTIQMASMSGGKSGSQWNYAPSAFTLIVTPADSTPPVISYTLTPATPDGNNDWYQSDVTLLWSVTDPESAVTKTGCVDQIITADQAEVTYSCAASSVGGSAGPVEVTIKRDATAPGIDWVGSIDDGDSFVYGSVPAAPTCEATDTLSGPDACEVTGYGASAGSYTLTATATDVAGNVTLEARSYTVNKAGSTVTVSCPASVTYNGSAQEPCTASYSTEDGLSGSLAVNYADNTYAGTATASASYAGDANHEGSSGSATFIIAKAPVTATAGSGSATYDGATHEPSACVVTGDYLGDLTCANDPASVGPAAGTYTISPVVSGTGLDNFEVTSVDGSYTINKADATCTVAGYNVIYDGNAHTATGSCTGVLGETLSGLDLSGTTHTLVGNYTDNWVFTDVTGNYNNASGTVNDKILAWTLYGFYAPVDMNGVYNVIKGGSTVPLKFEVFAGPTELTATSVVKSFVQTKITCDGSALTDEIEVTTTGGTSLRYDTTAGQFIQNWQTPKTAGVCYRVTMTTLDGSFLQAFFKLK